MRRPHPANPTEEAQLRHRLAVLYRRDSKLLRRLIGVEMNACLRSHCQLPEMVVSSPIIYRVPN